MSYPISLYNSRPLLRSSWWKTNQPSPWFACAYCGRSPDGDASCRGCGAPASNYVDALTGMGVTRDEARQRLEAEIAYAGIRSQLQDAMHAATRRRAALCLAPILGIY